MRIPGIGAEIVNQLGGTAVNMPAGEIMPALQQGVIDGRMGRTLQIKLRLHKLLNIITVLEFMSLALLMN